MTAISVPERQALQQPLAPVPAPAGRAPARFSAVLQPPGQGLRWRHALRMLLPHWQLVEPDDAAGLAQAQVLLTARFDPRKAAAMPHLRLVQLLGGPIDSAAAAQLPARVRVARTCAAHEVRQATEYAAASVLHYHRGFDVYGAQQRRACWQPLPVRTADERRVGIMGLGRLGSAVARQLAMLGFRVRGWSRGAHEIPGVTAFHGSDGLEAFLRATEILVCLLPLTGSTRGLLDARVFGALPPGARLVHLGPAAVLAQDDLLHALETGQLAHATLDVAAAADGETPGCSDALCRHARVTVTPGVAARLRPELGAALVARNLGRWIRNETLPQQMDRERGY